MLFHRRPLLDFSQRPVNGSYMHQRRRYFHVRLINEWFSRLANLGSNCHPPKLLLAHRWLLLFRSCRFYLVLQSWIFWSRSWPRNTSQHQRRWSLTQSWSNLVLSRHWSPLEYGSTTRYSQKSGPVSWRYPPSQTQPLVRLHKRCKAVRQQT